MTPYLHAAILPPPCLGDTIARMQAQLDSQAEQLRILGELVEALRGEVDRLNAKYEHDEQQEHTK